MNECYRSCPSFGGGYLVGDNAVRFAHLDEAGTSMREPIVGVAGVVTHADKQWRAIDKYLSDLADELVPARYRDGVIFHAKDLFHGTRKFHRDNWSRKKRNKLLEEIASIPARFDLPVVVGCVVKNNVTWAIEETAETVNANNYALAFGCCCVAVEYYMRNGAEPDEVATIIAEDVPHMRQHAKWGYNILSDPNYQFGNQGNIMKEYLPITKIVEHPQFAEKHTSSILQIADLIAFSFVRQANKKDDVRHLVKKYYDNIVALPLWFEA